MNRSVTLAPARRSVRTAVFGGAADVENKGLAKVSQTRTAMGLRLWSDLADWLRENNAALTASLSTTGAAAQVTLSGLTGPLYGGLSDKAGHLSFGQGQDLPAPTGTRSASARRAPAKPGGGQRQLGIPVVVDRLVQQMILQVLDPIFDPTFSNSSYGFRPGRSPHMALEQARKYAASAQDRRQTPPSHHPALLTGGHDAGRGVRYPRRRNA
jgi:hypothetical protein